MQMIVKKVRFKVFLKMLNVAEERTAGGRLFHVLGPSTANARSLNIERLVVAVIVTNRGRRRKWPSPVDVRRCWQPYRGKCPRRTVVRCESLDCLSNTHRNIKSFTALSRLRKITFSQHFHALRHIVSFILDPCKRQVSQGFKAPQTQLWQVFHALKSSQNVTITKS